MPSAAAPADQCAAPDAPSLADRQAAALAELAQLGLGIARALHARATSGEGDVAVVAHAFARVSRAVRMTFALQSKLLRDHQVADEETARQGRLAAIDAAFALERTADARKATLQRLVERVAASGEDTDAGAVDRLVDEACERLRDESLYDVMDRPVSETLARICKDLGLAPDWPALAGEPWAIDELQSEDIGWPLAGFASPPCDDPPSADDLRPEPPPPDPPPRRPH